MSSPQALEDALRAHPQGELVIVDLDETLWLRNSAEAFLDHARPRLLVATLLTAIDSLRPWRVLGGGPGRGFVFRDWLRVVMVVMLTPWNVWRWYRSAPAIACSGRNQELVDILERSGHLAAGQIVVATHGFWGIVQPLVSQLLPQASLVAPPLALGWLWRARGKARLLQARLDPARLRRAFFLSDHAEHDRDVLGEVATAIVLRWPEARFEPACDEAYAPFRYTLKGKHAGRNHVLRVFLGRDALALILASALATAAPLAAAVAYVFLILSFFIVYEIGYHENDWLGREREASPILTRHRLSELGTLIEAQAWTCALIMAVPALFILAAYDLSAHGLGSLSENVLWLGLLWVVVLLVTRALFALFNRIDELSRITIYLPLQVMKGIGMAVVMGLPLTPAGAALLAALAVSRWIPYVIYRSTGHRWDTPERLFRLLILCTFFVAFLPVVGIGSVSTLGTAAVFLWSLWEARREGVDAIRHTRWLRPRS